MSESYNDKTKEAVQHLGEKRSAKRRAAAKRLRHLKDPSAGPALLAALQKEVQDRRTWETQYQMIMALGECEYKPALPYLESLSKDPFEATMLYTALGDAIARLGREHEDDTTPVLRLMESNNDMLIDGAFRAVAMLHIQLNEEAVGRIVRFVDRRSDYDGLRFWVAVAAAGWTGSEVARFLEECAASPRNDVKQAALTSQQKKYGKWSPL